MEDKISEFDIALEDMESTHGLDCDFQFRCGGNLYYNKLKEMHKYKGHDVVYDHHISPNEFICIPKNN